jgi:hypothetical protein
MIIKRFSAIAIALSLAVGMTACSNSNASDTQSTTDVSGVSDASVSESTSSDDSENTADSISWVVLDVSSENSVNISTSDDTSAAAYSPLACTVKGSTLTDNNLISQVSTCSDFGSYFSASYDVERENLQSANFVFTPESANEYEEGNYGVNYFRMLQSVSTMSCDSVEIRYLDFTNINGQTGQFTITLYPLSDENQDKLGFYKIEVAGDAGDEPNDIKCTFTDTGFVFESSNDISDLSVSEFDEDNTAEPQYIGTSNGFTYDSESHTCE